MFEQVGALNSVSNYAISLLACLSDQVFYHLNALRYNLI